jgi:MSHA biogenesis protein MshN
MSLINQVLNDLEQRRADAGSARLPRDVRPLPAVQSLRGRLIGVGAALIGLLAVAIWAWQTWGPDRPLPAVAGDTAQAVQNTAMPPLAVLTPDSSSGERPEPVLSASAVPHGEVVPPGTPVAAAQPVARGDGLPSLRLSSELLVGSPPRAAAGASQVPSPASAPRTSAPREAMAPAPLPDPAAAPALAPAASVATPPVAPVDPATGLIDKQPVATTAQERAERLYRSALAQVNAGRADDGLTTLRAALREDPSHVAARQTLIRMYVESRSWDAAAGVLRDGLERRPDQAAWAMLLSRLLVERGDNAGALQVLEKHEAGGGGGAAYLAGMAAVLQRSDRQADAAVRYEQAARAEPANGRWWLGLATAREALGQSAEARDAYQRAIATRNLPADLQAFAEAKLK